MESVVLSHVIYELMIQWLTQDSLLDELMLLNTYWSNNVIDESLFEASNYFQKLIYSILIATVYIRVYIQTINFYPSSSAIIWRFVTEVMILCGRKDCDAVSFI